MTQEDKRARRRRDHDRMKAKARRLYPDQPKAAWRADYLASCSCAMCGNPRHVWKDGRLTMQERRQEARDETDD